MGMRRRQGQARWVALVAAYLLFFQALIGGFALGASASPAAPDPLSALCGIDTRAPDRTGQPQPAGQLHMPDCCSTGCSMFSGAPVPVFVAVLLVPQLTAAPEPAPRRAAPVAAPAPRSPANPRAPPVQA